MIIITDTIEFYYKRIYDKFSYKKKGYSYEYIKEVIQQNFSQYSSYLPPFDFNKSNKTYIEVYKEYIESDLSLETLDIKYNLPKGHLARKFRKFDFPAKNRSRIMKDAWKSMPSNFLNGIDKGIKKREETYRKRAKEDIDKSIFILDSYGIKIGFKRNWFKKKYPKYTYDIYQESAWKEKSLEICNKRNWICEKCGNYGDESHHLRNFYNQPEIALDDSNLQLLCHKCHEEITKTRKEYAKKNYNM